MKVCSTTPLSLRLCAFDMIMPWLASASHGPPPSPTLIPPQELPSTHGLLPTMTQSSTITTPTATAYDSRNKITCPWHRQRLWPSNTSNSNHKQQQLLLPHPSNPPSLRFRWAIARPATNHWQAGERLAPLPLVGRHPVTNDYEILLDQGSAFTGAQSRRAPLHSTLAEEITTCCYSR